MNLKGGYILLNLCAISLALSGEPVTITNADVLKKLSELQMYVGTDEFKSQPKVGLKPVLVQYRSNESKINGVILCKCGFDTNNKKLIISGTDGENLSIQIECVFVDNPEDVKVTPYVLQSAKITAYRGVIGDLDILGDLSVSGSINGEENPSVKPIYYHSIYIAQEFHENTEDVESRCTLVIFDNSDTPYTTNRLISKITELMNNGSYIQINGYFKDASNTVINLYMVTKFADNDYRAYGNAVNGRIQTNIMNIINDRCSISDGLNKIN